MANCYVFCIGCLSGIGKGLVSASTVLLLKSRGHTVQYIKFDPYLSLSSGLLSPNEHGETYVLDCGVECDLDLGHIERITSLTLNGDNICTSGMIFKELIEEQEHGEYLGKTITNNPFVINKINKRLEKLGEQAEVVVCEIGGSVDDSETKPFLDAIRVFRQKHNCIIILLSLVLWMKVIGEFKTKLVQRGVRDLQSHGLTPDILICRSEKPIPHTILQKISGLTGMNTEDILTGLDYPLIYSVPVHLYEQGLDDIVADKLRLGRHYCRIRKYKDLVEKCLQNDRCITLAIVSKYENCDEAHLSIKEAIMHAAIAKGLQPKIKWVKTSDLEGSKLEIVFAGVQGIVVAGGFGPRGIPEKIATIRYAREKKLPFFGICLGLQCAIIEFARNVLHLEDADSVEFNKETSDPVVHYVAGQENIKKKVNSMRLGAYDCEITKNTLAYELYGQRLITERHRHRLEYNREYIARFTEAGFVVSGINPGSGLVEIMELRRDLHPFFIGCQAHPEFNSRLTSPSPLFLGLVEAAFKKVGSSADN